MKSIIDKNIPLTMASRGLVGLTYLGHAVTIFGYQYIEIENTIIFSDAHSTYLIDKTFNSMPVHTDTTAFSYYFGW